MIQKSTEGSSPEMSSPTEILDRLRNDFEDEEYRHGYVEAELATRLAVQIRRLREDRGWTQKKLAELAGTKQSAISKLEDPGYGRYSLSLLLELARVFDVAIDVAFVPFSTALARAMGGLEGLSIKSFAEDPFFESGSKWAGAKILPFRRPGPPAAWSSSPLPNQAAYV